MNFDNKLRRKQTADKLFPFKEVTVNQTRIVSVEQFKYLGVILDNNLRFGAQLSATIRSVNDKTYLLQKIRSSINRDTAIVLFKTMVLPYLEFASSLLIGCTQKEKVKLQRLQNRGLRLALGRNRLHGTIELHREGKLAGWEIRAKIALCRLVFKRKYDEEFLVERRDTRLMDGPVFAMVMPKSEYYRRSTSYESRRIWNTLPADIRRIDDFEVFKVRIKG